MQENILCQLTIEEKK